MKAKIVLIIWVCVTIVACRSSRQNPETLTSDMHQLSASLSTLLPLVHDPLQFHDASNREIIQQEVARLSQFKHSFNDPALNFVAARFGADMQEARRQLSLGNTTASRTMLRNATNYCISCHTQTSRGPQLSVSAANPFYKRLNSLDRTVYLIAIRSFDEAIVEFDKAMNSPDVALQPFPSLESATLKVLAVAVRVKKDPKLAERIVTRMLDSKWAPVYLQLSGLKWRASIKEWAASPGQTQSLSEAKKLISLAVKKQMESPLSRAGLIENLRASAILHDLLDQKGKVKSYPETLYYAGLASEALRELDLLDISDRYFETCIRAKPHSPIARRCYIRLESAQVATFKESEPGFLPGAVREKLDELKKMAETKGQAWDEP